MEVEGEKIRILLIEDNPGDARLLRELLAAKDGASFDLEHVDRLSTGLARLARGNIDVILLDLSLPDSHDLDGLGKILAQTLEVPIVVLSGLSDEAVAINAVQEGAQDYLVKGSVDSDLLVRSLHYAIERQHLRVALRESESRYRLLADNVADVIWTANMKWQITYVSPSITRLLGYTIEETMKLTINDILTHDSMEQARKVIVDQMEIRTPTSHYPPMSMTLEHLRKDGSPLWAEVMLSFLWDKDGKLISIMGATRDITERKKAEEALRDSQDRYRLLADNSVDVIWTVDEKGRLTYVNPSITRLLGYTVDEVMATKLSKLFTPASAETARKLVKWEMATGVEGSQDSSRSVVLEHVHKDGSTIWTEVVMLFLRDKQGRLSGIQGVTRDITERKKAEEALRESENQYRSLVDTASKAGLGITIVQDTQDEEAVFVFVNDEYCKISGYSREELLERSAWNTVPPDNLAATRERYRQRQRGENITGHYEANLLRKDGTLLPIELSVSTFNYQGKIATVSFFKDITERKKAEETLRQSEERYRELIENANDIIYTHDLAGNFTSINKAGERVTGYTRDEVLGMNISRILTPETLEQARQMIAHKVNQGGQTQYEMEIVAKDGHRILLEVSSRLIYEGDKPVSVQGIARDITERKKMEQALKESEERLKRYWNSSPDAIYIHDLKGTFLRGNKAGKELLGYSADEIEGRSFLELPILPPEYLPKAIQLLQLSEAGKPTGPDEFELVRKDGKHVFVEISAYPMTQGDKTEVIGIARNITERKRMEDALRESEERHRLYFENASDVIFSVNLEGRLLSISRSVERYLGYKPEELIGKKLGDMNLLSPQSQELALYGMMRILAGEQVTASEGEFIAKDGTRKFGEVSSAPIFSPDGKVAEIICVARDITERKLMEDALRESEERFRRLVDHAPDIIFRWSVEKGLEYVSPVVAAITGYSVEELMADPQLGLELARGKNSDLVQDYERVVEHGITERTKELTFVSKDGKRAYLDIRTQAIRNKEGEIIAFEGILRDITERREMEEALKRSEQNYRVLFESTIDGMLVFDVETMKVVIANRTALQMLGFDCVEDVIGMNLLDLIHPDERDRVTRIIMENAFGRGLDEIRELRAITRDGRQIWVSVMGTRIEYEGKMADLVSARDITERKQMEEERQRMEEQLRLAGRLAAVGELAAGVAHELNNPIAAIKGFAQFLTAREDLDETIRKDLDTIYRESQRAAKITQNLLSFARRHEPEKHPISINDVIENILEMQDHLMKVNNIELEVELDPDLPKTLADFHQMQQVFMNIVNNAEQAMIEAHGKGRLLIKTQRSGKMVQITFADNGPGISEENLKRIFDPFFTTKEVGKGTGLGLSICYGLVEAHGGRIYAKSKLGQGATFVVEMPIVSKNQLVAEAALLNPGSRGVKWNKPGKQY